MSTDSEWEAWGRRDPYFGVITDPKFRLASLTPEGRAEFFESGRVHVDYVLEMIRRHVDPDHRPQSILDFGCGVGRMLVHFAGVAAKVVGVDVSPSMLREARANCEALRLWNVETRLSDDALASTPETYDLVHSFIVLQHLPADRGMRILRNLLARIRPGGVGAVHVLYSKLAYAPSSGLPPKVAPKSKRPRASGGDPEMQMNPYNMTEVLFALQRAGVTRLQAEFTDHGGELGLIMFFKVKR